MIDRDSPVTEDELHAYIDGELPADRKEAIAKWLADHPEQGALVASWRAQAESIRVRYGAVGEEPVPERLKLEQVLSHDRRNGRSWAAMTAAAAIVAFVLGGGTGWLARGVSAAAPTGFDVFASEALDAYKLYVVEVRHPVEVPGSERAHMTQWLSKRLGEELRIPDLQAIGLKLVGGRLLPGPTGAAAFYMYESPSGERVLHQRRAIRGVLLGRRQDRLCREWPGRPRAARVGDQIGLRTDRQERGEEVVNFTSS